MKSYIALAIASTALALPQQQSGSSECSSSAEGTFQIQTVVKPTKRDLESRQLSGVLTLTLENGILKDQAGRQGYVAANDQYVSQSCVHELDTNTNQVPVRRTRSGWCSRD